MDNWSDCNLSMKPFTEEARYEYDLTPDSVVLDCGGYEGTFTDRISDRYHCTVHVLEPVRRFYDNIVKRVGGRSRVFVHPWGIGERTCEAKFSIKGDMTGEYANNPETETVFLKDVQDIFTALGLGRVNLLKLNIEGGEFTAVEQLIATGLIDRVDNLQVQWHPVVHDYQARFDALQAALAKTHELTFDAQWVWQNWKRK